MWVHFLGWGMWTLRGVLNGSSSTPSPILETSSETIRNPAAGVYGALRNGFATPSLQRLSDSAIRSRTLRRVKGREIVFPHFPYIIHVAK